MLCAKAPFYDINERCVDMRYQYNTKGVCSSLIELDMQDDIILEVIFKGGCDGNLKGLSRLVTGMRAQDAINLLEGIHCGSRGTSCPDQLTKALKEWIMANT